MSAQARISERIRIEGQIKKALRQLSIAERMRLELAADDPRPGGKPLEGILRRKAASLDLAYERTGRVKPNVIRILKEELHKRWSA